MVMTWETDEIEPGLVEITCQDAWGATLAAEFEEAQLQGTDEAALQLRVYITGLL